MGDTRMWFSFLVVCLWFACPGTFLQAAEEGRRSIVAPQHRVGEWYEFTTLQGKPYRLTLTEKDAAGAVFTLSLDTDPRLKINEESSVVAVKVAMNNAYEWLAMKPHGFNYSFPLYEGKEWTGSYTWTLGRYEGIDKVVAKVGKITKMAFGEVEIEVIQVSYVIESQSGGRIQNMSSTCWYAPAIGYTLKCESESTRLKLNVIGYGVLAKD